MAELNHDQHRPLARRDFVRQIALAGGGVTLAGAAACGATEAGPSAAAPVAEELSQAPTTDFELYHEVYGEGPPVVFAHGAGGTHMSWWKQIPTFSKQFTCITYAQRGFGFSPDVPGGPGRGAFAEDLRTLLDSLGIERASLVGQSMGGRSVLGFAAAYPERVNALVMSSTTGGYRDADLDALRAAAPDLGARSAVAAAYAERDPEGAFLYRMVSRTNRYLAEAGDEAPTVETPVPDIEQIVSAGVRTLFLVGERDTVAPPTVTKALHAKMAGSSLVTFPESGHSPYWEIHEEFNRVVIDFLRG
jgi:pimeloyl-ACP methyl ester carboxylesterase